MNDPVVRAIGLGRDFGQTRALEQVDVAIQAGTILGLLGPNGAGKTTLMRLLMGLIEPTRGHAMVLGGPSRDPSSAVGGSIAYVGDRCEPARWATPRMLAQLQGGAVPAFDGELFKQYCSQQDLEMNRPYGVMSKGQRRWILTSLALASGSKLILLDEPADGLDPAVRVKLYDMVRQHVNDTDATAVITTHVIGDIQRVADDVAIIDGGRLVLHAPLDDLRESVREIQLPEDQTLPDLGPVGQVIGSKVTGGVRLIWIRLHEPVEDGFRGILNERATIRAVGLEALYLAMTENRTEDQGVGAGRMQ